MKSLTITEYIVYILIGVFLAIIIYFFIFLFYIRIEEYFKNKLKVKNKRKIQEMIDEIISKKRKWKPAEFDKLTTSRNKAAGALEILSEMIESDHDNIKIYQKIISDCKLKKYLLKDLKSRNINNSIYAIKLIGDFEVHEVLPKVKQKIYANNNNLNLQYQGLATLMKCGDYEGLKEYIVDKKNPIYLTNRSLQEILSLYKGEKKQLYKMLLKANDNYIKIMVLKMVGFEKMADFIPEILKYIDSNNVSLKIACIKALSCFKEEKVAKKIEKYAFDEKWEVRAQAVKALGALGDRNTLHILEQSLADKEWWVRYNAAWAITKFKRIEKLTERVLTGKDNFAKQILSFVLANSEFGGK